MTSIEVLWKEFYKEKKMCIHGLWAIDTTAKKFLLFVRKKERKEASQ